MDPETTETYTDSNRYLRHLARLYPSVEAGQSMGRISPVPASSLSDTPSPSG